jgi:hypothetical protein
MLQMIVQLGKQKAISASGSTLQRCQMIIKWGKTLPVSATSSTLQCCQMTIKGEKHGQFEPLVRLDLPTLPNH